MMERASLTPRAREAMLQAAVDGELDAVSLAAFEKQMAEDPALQEDYDRLVALRLAFRRLPRPEAGADFRARIAAIGQEAQAAQSVSQQRGYTGSAWRSSALAATLALMLGGGGAFLAMRETPPDITQQLISDHTRGLISGQLTDVLSSDRHTVKPWFAPRLPQAVRVLDLSARGFPLVGGRVDVVDGKPLATLVYQRDKHFISVTQLPGIVAAYGAGETHGVSNGYAIQTWTLPNGSNPEAAGAGVTTYIAVSDIAGHELEALSEAFRTAAAADK